MNTLAPSESLKELPEQPARRCSDFDSECKDVIDHAACFCGGVIFATDGTIYTTPVADGYCPFLVGQLASKIV